MVPMATITPIVTIVSIATMMPMAKMAKIDPMATVASCNIGANADLKETMMIHRLNNGANCDNNANGDNGENNSNGDSGDIKEMMMIRW